MTQYIQSSPYETVQLDNEWIVMNTDQFTVTKLNQIGGYCWTLLQQPQTISSLISEIKKNFKLETKASDLETFIVELMEYGLVKHAI